MHPKGLLRISCAMLLCLACATRTFAQTTKGIVTGRATDAAGAILQGARIDLEPKVSPAISGAQGEFTIPNVMPGTYALSVRYVGFARYYKTITVIAGQSTYVDAALSDSG